MPDKKLYRDEENGMVAGICKGISDFTDVDVSIVRLIFLLGSLGYGAFIIIYAILYFILPTKVDTPPE